MDLDNFFTECISCTTNNDFRGASLLLTKLLSLSVTRAEPSSQELVKVIEDVVNMAGDDVEKARDGGMDITETAMNEGNRVYLPSIVVDILWLLDQDDSLLQEQRKRLNEIGQLLFEKRLINAETAQERLEPEFLEAIQAIQDAKAFDKKIIRTKTNLLYKQTKFNLLREESEGYSKLSVEMLEHLVQPLDYYWSADKAEKKVTHEELALIRMADIEGQTQILMDNITCLIGYFDLDPIRVLDLILDAFISQCLDYWDFYVHLLKKSPWKPVQGVPKQVLAQILGFKFRFYARSDQALNNTPVQLYWTAAVLIREGLVALDDLYPHLDPVDESSLKKELFEYLSGLQKRASKAGRFAPTKMMGSLDDASSATPTVEQERKTDDESIPKTQKAGLVFALAALGDIKNLRITLDRMPSLSKVHPEIADNICRILHVVVEDLDKPLRPFANLERKAPPSIHEFPPPVSSFNVRVAPVFERITTGKKHYPSQYKFFYDNWRDQAPRPSNFAGLLKVLRALLPYIGAHLYRDVLLTGKLIRLGRKHIKECLDDDPLKKTWLAIISQFLFPAISQMPSNPSLAHELWTFVKLWPYSVRYALYGEWKHETYDKIPELAVASAGCRKDIQYIMNRLSKDNIKTYGRLIGKIVHSNPTIAFSYILNAIESYDNMIPYVVEATRYLTDLEFDILSFCLIEALARESKVRIERNGTTIEKWLKSLSNFCGTLFAKYKIDLDGILRYLTNQLLSDQVYDLIVLQELITSMSGISPPEDATAAQLDGMAGGEVIRRESLTADSHLLRRSTARLVQALVIKTELALPFGVLLAQQKKEISFRLGNEDPFTAPDLKVIAWLSDQCQKSFLQYFEFLENNAGAARYAKFCPTLKELIEKYGLDTTSAFHIVRPHLSNLMKKDISALAMSAKNGVIDSPDVSSSPPAAGEAMDVDEVAGAPLFDLPSPLLDISAQVAELGIKHDLSLSFFVTFWQLGLSDISVPHARYDSEIKKKEEQIEALEKETGRGASKRKKEKERLQLVIQDLKQELNFQQDHYAKTRERLLAEKDSWFMQLDVSRSEIINQILQNCIFPRSMFSAGDALYCAKFLELLHENGTANLSIVSLYDRILNRDSLHAVIFSLTESEAKNFGSFLNLCLQKLTRWHSRKSVYESSALAPGRPGFLVKFPDEPVTAEVMKTLKMFDYEDFRTAMHKWHLKMRKCFLQCLSSGDYMQLRNGMIVLNKISEYFPLIDYMGKELESSVSKIEKKEERADVKQMARSYYANLRRRKSHWIPTSKFCNQSKPVIPPEDEIAESVESSSVADLTEDPNDRAEDAQMESGEVRGMGSEMDVDEAVGGDLQSAAGVAPEEGTDALEVEESTGERIISVVSSTALNSSVDAAAGSEHAKLASTAESGKNVERDRRGGREENDSSTRIVKSASISRDAVKIDGSGATRDISSSNAPSKLERTDSRRSDRDRNSRTDNSRDSRDKQGSTDSGNRNGRDRDDRSWRDSGSGSDRNQRAKDEAPLRDSRDNRDLRRNPADDRNSGRRDDRNQRRDERDAYSVASRDSRAVDESRGRRRDDAKESSKQQSNRSPPNVGRGSEERKREDATRPASGNNNDRSNRDRPTNHGGQTTPVSDNRMNDSRRYDDRSSSRRSDARPQREADRQSGDSALASALPSKDKVNTDKSSDIDPSSRSDPSSKSRDDRGNSGDRDSSSRTGNEKVSSQEPKQQQSTPAGGSADQNRAKQISREEKDRLLLARIDMEKKSLENNKQAAQSQPDATNSEQRINSNHSSSLGREGESDARRDDRPSSTDRKNASGQEKDAVENGKQPRPRFERPQRSNLRGPNADPSNGPSVSQPSQPDQNIERPVSSVDPPIEKRDIVHGENRDNDKANADSNTANNQRPDSGNSGKHRDGPPPRDFRHADRRGGGSDYNNNGGSGNRNNRGEGDRRGYYGDSRGDRSGNGGGQQGRNYDNNNRGRGGQSQQRGGGRQQQDRDRGRDDSKRTSEGDRNDAKRFKLQR